jgi:glyoxylase-like metal-dependent hydrolase (beta-lactamase superfamily II)
MRQATSCCRTRLAILVAALLVSRPALAQFDVSGEWATRYNEDAPHRGSVEIGDYTGLPINEAARLKATTWDENVQSTPERQCIPHVAVYQMRGPSNFRIAKVADPDSGQLISFNMYGTYGRPRTIWMDGRPHPSEYAAHTWTGFSTGRWEGNALVVDTTHIKMGWILRNGVPTSDRATMTEHFIRHDDQLMIVSIVTDPVYLEEPFIRTSNWVLSLTGNANAWGPCGPAQITDELGGTHPKGYVPHHLPGTNAMLQEFTSKHNVPAEAALGGAETTYPEYMARLRQPGGARPASPPPSAAPARSDAPPTASPAGGLEVLPVQGNVYMIAGAGGNVAVQIGEDGVLLVDTGSARMTDQVQAAIRKLSDKPVRYILNTHYHPDQTGGNEILAKSGSKVGGGLIVGGTAGAGGAPVIAHQGVLMAMSAPAGKTAPTPVGAWPTDAYFGGSKEVFSNGEAIEMLHQPAAHTDGDSIVFFRRSDVVVAGGIYSTLSYPVIDAEKGGTFSGVIAGLNRIIDLTIPRDWQEGGTMVIPGSGRLTDEADVVEYRDMVTIIRDRIQDLIKKGMTLEQVKAARPTRDYDGRYGADSGTWTTAMFVEAAYRDLSRKP